MGLSVYDALADEHEPGAREALLTRLFARLERELPPLVDAVVAVQARAPRAPELVGPFPVARQAARPPRSPSAWASTSRVVAST